MSGNLCPWPRLQWGPVHPSWTKLILILTCQIADSPHVKAQSSAQRARPYILARLPTLPVFDSCFQNPRHAPFPTSSLAKRLFGSTTKKVVGHETRPTGCGRSREDTAICAADKDISLQHVIEPITLKPVVTHQVAGRPRNGYGAVVAVQGTCRFSQQPLRHGHLTHPLHLFLY